MSSRLNDATSDADLVVRARRLAVSIGRPLDRLSDEQVLGGVARLRCAVEHSAAATEARRMQLADHLTAERLRLELDRRQAAREHDGIQTELRNHLRRRARRAASRPGTAAAHSATEQMLLRRRDRLWAQLRVIEALAHEIDALRTLAKPADDQLARANGA